MRHLSRPLNKPPGLTRARVRGWLEQGLVRVNGQAARPSRRLALGDEVEILIQPPPPRPEPVPLDRPLSVVFEDDWLLALDKPPGVVVHPAPGNWDDTLLHALLWRARDWGGRRPHLVSRLDKGTSGLLLVAKTPEVHAALKAGPAEKDYLALVYGRTEGAKGRIDLGVLRDPGEPRRMTASRTGGNPSTTLWERLGEAAGGEPLTLLRCRLLTGRMHQIRVHLRAVRLPIVGDPAYGAPGWKGIADPALADLCRGFPRQALHAWRLSLTHPITGETLALSTPPPLDLESLLAAAGLSV